MKIEWPDLELPPINLLNAPALDGQMRGKLLPELKNQSALNYNVDTQGEQFAPPLEKT
jgi:hypothetical protein